MEKIKDFLASVVARFSVVFSGALFFFVSSYLYGVEARGILAIGSSIVGVTSLILSLNIGRIFLQNTKENLDVKNNEINKYLFIQFILFLFTSIIVIVIWNLSDVFRSTIDRNLLIIFISGIPIYHWAINGHLFFSGFNKVHIQEKIIILIRTLLLIFCLSSIFIKQSFAWFLLFYYLILTAGVMCEILFLINFKNIVKENNFSITQKFKKNLNPFFMHLDYIFFHSFPLIVVIISSLSIQSISIAQIGMLNFILQLAAFVYTLAFIFSIKIKAQIFNELPQDRLSHILLITLLLSCVLTVIIFISMKSIYFIEYFPDFTNLENLFILMFFAVPGFIMYYLIYPFIIKEEASSDIFQPSLYIFVSCVVMAYFLLNKFGIEGAIFSIVLYNSLIGITYLTWARKSSKK